MAGYKDGFQYLERLRELNPQRKQTFESIKHYLSAKATRNGIPSYGILELTPLCNFDCKMCYAHLRKDQLGGKKLLIVEQWKGLIHEAWEAGMMFATLTGGECLSYPGFRELYLYLRSLGVLVNVMTNGALMDENWVEFFRERKPAKMTITLYGSDEETYESVTGQRKFSAVNRIIRQLIEAGINLSVNVTPNRYMGENVLDTIRLAMSYGVSCSINSLLFEPREETGRKGQAHDLDADDYVRIFRLYNELKGVAIPEIDPEKLPPPGGPCHECTEYGLPCKAGRAAFTIQWDGVMYPCNSVRHFSASPLEEGFRPAWDSIRRQCATWPRIPECKDCAYESVCVHCPAIRAQFAKPGKQPLALCERTRYLVQHGVAAIPECEE